jgi:hypothetical protein
MPLDGLEKGGVLTLDLGWRTIGWCLGWDDGPDRRIFGSWVLPNIGGRGAMFTAADNVLMETLQVCEPVSVIAEDALDVHGQTDQITAKKQYGLEGIVCMQCYRHSIPFSTVSANLVRNAILGQSRFPRRGEAKKAVMGFCRRRGWNVRNDHEGDSVMIFEWHNRQVRNIRPAAGPLWREVVY